MVQRACNETGRWVVERHVRSALAALWLGLSATVAGGRPPSPLAEWQAMPGDVLEVCSMDWSIRHRRSQEPSELDAAIDRDHSITCIRSSDSFTVARAVQRIASVRCRPAPRASGDYYVRIRVLAEGRPRLVVHVAPHGWWLRVPGDARTWNSAKDGTWLTDVIAVAVGFVDQEVIFQPRPSGQKKPAVSGGSSGTSATAPWRRWRPGRPQRDATGAGASGASKSP